ncbi:MAG: ABC transporter permease [Treponema sp.]|jgi:rhamnose transport system permease protein|nr:ABC transporter permease [Treponema sp.]
MNSKKKTRSSFRELGLLGFIVVIGILVEIRNPMFLTLNNLRDIGVNTSILSILAVGMLMVLLTAGIDLSIGATIAFSGMCVALTLKVHPGVPIFVALLEGMAIGALVGAVLGTFVSRFSILPIIASLGMMNIVRGVTYVVSGSKWVSAYQLPDDFKDFATGSFLGISHFLWIAIIVYVVFFYFLNYTKVGRWIYAVGSNPAAAKISGIPKRRVTALVYILMGLLAGLAGVLWVSKYASAQGNTASGYEMDVIAACVIGGVSITGGRGKISGLILGCLLFGILNNALPLINVSPFWQNAIEGLVIMVAIIVNIVIERRIDRKALMAREI